jgi:hypothetical protein
VARNYQDRNYNDHWPSDIYYVCVHVHHGYGGCRLHLVKISVSHQRLQVSRAVAYNARQNQPEHQQEYDVVLASRSFMGIHEIKEVILNIQEIAKKYVFLVVFGRNNWMLEKKFYDSNGKRYPDFAPYDYLFNLLISLGIYPNVENFDLVGNRKYDDIEDAFIRMKWKMNELSEDEIEKIRPFLKENLSKNEEDGMFENPIDKADIVLMWWKK